MKLTDEELKLAFSKLKRFTLEDIAQAIRKAYKEKNK